MLSHEDILLTSCCFDLTPLDPKLLPKPLDQDLRMRHIQTGRNNIKIGNLSRVPFGCSSGSLPYPLFVCDTDPRHFVCIKHIGTAARDVQGSCSLHVEVLLVMLTLLNVCVLIDTDVGFGVWGLGFGVWGL